MTHSPNYLKIFRIYWCTSICIDIFMKFNQIHCCIIKNIFLTTSKYLSISFKIHSLVTNCFLTKYVKKKITNFSPIFYY